MAKLQGDFSQRVEVERKMKERHDLHIQQPFPENEETAPTKEVEEEQKEETLAQTVKAVKRMKSLASKKQTKRPRIEEVQKEVEPVVATPGEQFSQQGAEQSEQSEIKGRNTSGLKEWGTNMRSTQPGKDRSCSRSDLEEMYKVGMNLYGEVLKGTEMSLLRITMEYLCMMFDPESEAKDKRLAS
ncbi:hypothetical protein L6452_06646 [Arctium lappa]|uniref:Uncharacterized protein n=1 Tax=Arctium lappa TaxID=4217 RepID=A0ACB9EKF2_ARCLA|nr:hypothetical protein L6452_06646 [Arctium lappa]